MKNIILIGMMGCGKTTCGRLLARRLGRELVDTDALIVEREGRSIPDIFAQRSMAISELCLKISLKKSIEMSLLMQISV